MFRTTTIRRCTVVTAVLVGICSTTLGLGATAAVADDTSTATSATTAGADAPTETGTATSTTTATADAVTPADAGGTTDAGPTPSGAASAPTAPPTDVSSTDVSSTDVSSTDVTPAGTVTVSGIVEDWHTLTADTAGWPEGTTFTYQWQSSFADGEPIDVVGATDASMTISPTLGQLDRLRVRVTGTAPGQEPTTVTSELTAPVAENPDMRWGYLGTQTVHASIDEPFSQSLAAFDGDGLQYYVSDGPDAPADDSVLPDGVTFSADGTLSGTPTSLGVSEFWLHTSTGLHPNGSEISKVVLDVSSGPAVGLRVVVRGEITSTGWPSWVVDTDGSVTSIDSTEVQTGDPTKPIRVRQDGSLEVGALGFDRLDNVAELPDLTWSSSVDGDTFTPTDSTDTVTLRFTHASPHVITVRSGSLTQTFTVQVDPLPAVTTTSSTTTRTPSGQLAYTGADTSGPLASALGLLGAGAALVVARMRRRRA
ncbi:LPXTG cell wall anchor domain-containing protein [Curtobacterium sp. L3-7]|uniref:LPXTG cell wall anchor domain-containing protein n=1 Tax=Curtobacterium sp. L3-7 TaxID=3138787 RepID=UPI003B51B031